MDNYLTLKSILKDLNVMGYQIDTVAAKESLERDFARIKNIEERNILLLTLKQELEQALADPDIDWVKFSEEARFTFTLPNDISWFWNYPDGVINELKAVLYDFIYPERIVSSEDLIRVQRVTFFLMLECENLYKYVPFEAILKQLRTMKQHWVYLEYFHLNILLGMEFFNITYNYAEFSKNKVSLSRDRKSFLAWIDSYKYAPENSSYNPYEGWPPFSTDPSHPFYLKYDRESWLEILRNGT